MPSHSGSCSDCQCTVDTTVNGTCYSGAPSVMPTGASVYLLCKECIEKRNKNPEYSWLPGNFHEPHKIVVR